MDSNCVYFEIKNEKLAKIIKKNKVDLSISGDIIYSNSADCNFPRWLEIADEGYVEEDVARNKVAEWMVSFLSWMGNVYCGGFETLSNKNVKKTMEEIEQHSQEINYISNDGFIIKLCWCSPNGGANAFEVYHFEDGKMNTKRFNEYEYQELFPNDDRPFWQVMAEEGPEEMDRIFGCDNIELNTGNKKSTSTQQNDIDDRFDQIDDIEFEGKLFCFTGFEHSGRDLIGKNETVDSMMNFGGDIRSDVSSKVDYLVIDNYFGGKYDKAKELQQKGGKIKIISRDAFEKIVHIKLSNQTKKLKGKESKAENQLYKYKKQANGTIKIVEYKGNEEIITVPSHIENLPVTIIGEFAFSSIREYIHGGLFTSESYRDPLIAKQMILPDTIEKIESKAIKCNKLEEINIPTKITAVSNEMLPAFKRKGEGVENARIHLTENVTSITGKPFGTELYPRACTIIAPKGSYAETYAKRHSIDFEVEKQKNESNVVSDNVSTLKSEKEENHLKKPQNVSTPIIEQNITSKDKSISELSGLNNTTDAQQEIASKYFVIENGVLLKYKGYDTEITIPDGVTVIGKKAFKSNSMRKVVMPESVIEIGDSAFYGCLYLEEVQLSPKLQTIGKYAFYLCKFKSIEIPSSVKVIGDQAFGFDLKNITLLCENAKISGTAFNWDAKFSGPKKLYDRLLEENVSFAYGKKRWKNTDI